MGGDSHEFPAKHYAGHDYDGTGTGGGGGSSWDGKPAGPLGPWAYTSAIDGSTVMIVDKVPFGQGVHLIDDVGGHWKPGRTLGTVEPA